MYKIIHINRAGRAKVVVDERREVWGDGEPLESLGLGDMELGLKHKEMLGDNFRFHIRTWEH